MVIKKIMMYFTKARLSCVITVIALVIIDVIVFRWYIQTNLGVLWRRYTGSKERILKDSPSKDDTHFIISQQKICTNTGKQPPIPVLFMVFSGPESIVQRAAIRQTWGSHDNLNQWNARLVFLIGSRKGRRLREKLLQENSLYRDIILVNFVESYANLTRKSTAMLKWAVKYCPDVKFIAKVDGDVYVNVNTTIKLLQRYMDKPRLIIGRLFKNATVNRDKSSKYYVSSFELPGVYYPKYVSGTLYFLSRDIIPLLYDVTKIVPKFRMEDVYITGICASSLTGVNHVDVASISFKKRKADGCVYKNVVSGHKVNSRDMYAIHRQLHNTTIVCP